MPRQRERRSSAKADARRLKIVNTSARLFDQRGVDAVSMADIADEVGLAKPSLYHYFPSKEEILYSIHLNMINMLLERLEQRMQAEASPDVVLRGVLNDMFDSMDTHPGHARVFFEHSRRLSDEYREAVRSAERRYDDQISSVIAQGIADGYFRKMDPRVAALAFFGMSNWSYQWYTPNGKYRAHDLAEQFYEIFVHGIAARPASRGSRGTKGAQAE